jgi:hypothetical protein
LKSNKTTSQGSGTWIAVLHALLFKGKSLGNIPSFQVFFYCFPTFCTIRHSMSNRPPIKPAF